jgi:hypothetical protein
MGKELRTSIGLPLDAVGTLSPAKVASSIRTIWLRRLLFCVLGTAAVLVLYATTMGRLAAWVSHTRGSM